MQMAPCAATAVRVLRCNPSSPLCELDLAPLSLGGNGISGKTMQRNECVTYVCVINTRTISVHNQFFFKRSAWISLFFEIFCAGIIQECFIVKINPVLCCCFSVCHAPASGRNRNSAYLLKKGPYCRSWYYTWNRHTMHQTRLKVTYRLEFNLSALQRWQSHDRVKPDRTHTWWNLAVNCIKYV